MRQSMDVDRIRQAFRQRLTELHHRDPSLTKKAIAERMGASTKTVDNLTNSKPKSSFDLDILRRASRAVEWPAEALELIESGQAEPHEIDEEPWTVDAPWDPIEDGHRLATIEREQSEIREELADLRDALVDIRALVVHRLRPPAE